MGKRRRKIAEAIIEEHEGQRWLDLRLSLSKDKQSQQINTGGRLLIVAMLMVLLLALVLAILLLWERDPALGKLFLFFLVSVFGPLGAAIWKLQYPVS